VEAELQQDLLDPQIARHRCNDAIEKSARVQTIGAVHYRPHDDPRAAARWRQISIRFLYRTGLERYETVTAGQFGPDFRPLRRKTRCGNSSIYSRPCCLHGEVSDLKIPERADQMLRTSPGCSAGISASPVPTFTMRCSGRSSRFHQPPPSA